MKRHIFLVLIIAVVISGCAAKNATVRPHNTGDTAVDFTLPDQNGTMVTLSKILEDKRGAVIAFYPKDDSRN